MHRPLIKNEYTMIIMKAIMVVSGENIISNPSYIEKLFCAIIKEIIAKIKLITPVMIEDKVTDKNLPKIISLLFIGKVNNVSKVHLSFSPAVVSVAG